MPRHKNSVNFDPDAERMPFSTATQKQINADPPHWNEIILNHPHNSQIFFMRHWNQVKFELPYWNQVNSDQPHKMQVSFHAHTKNEWFSPRV